MTTARRKPRTASESPHAADVPAGGPFLLYLYCVVEERTPAHGLLERRGVGGVEDNEPLFPISAAGLVAAVSRVPASAFQEAALNARFRDIDRVAPVAVRHQQAVQALLPSSPALVPMTIGAVYRTPRRVSALLLQEADRFRRLLAHVRDRQEWSLKVFRDDPLLVLAADRSSPELQRLAQEADAATPGRAYLLRKQREKLVGVQAARFVRDRLDNLMRSLAPLAAETVLDDLPAEQDGPWPLALKTSFLLESARVQEFRAAVAALARESAPQGLRLELTGPWAPYSFVGERRR